MREVKVADQPSRDTVESEALDIFTRVRKLLWIITPLVVIFVIAIVISNIGKEWTWEIVTGVGISVAIAAALIVATVSPKKGHWGFRFVTFVIATFYLWYMIDQFVLAGDKFDVTVRSSEVNPFNALLGFLAIGVPCLIYTFYGRGRVRKSDDEELQDETLLDTLLHSVAKAAKWLFILLYGMSLVALIWRLL